MFKKILIANRGVNGHQAVAAKRNCMARAARTGDLSAMELHHV
jgi:hypothetical protein